MGLKKRTTVVIHNAMMDTIAARAQLHIPFEYNATWFPMVLWGTQFFHRKPRPDSCDVGKSICLPPELLHPHSACQTCGDETCIFWHLASIHTSIWEALSVNWPAPNTENRTTVWRLTRDDGPEAFANAELLLQLFYSVPDSSGWTGCT